MSTPKTTYLWPSIVSGTKLDLEVVLDADAFIESKYCILLNEAGRRFADETMGDEIVNQYLAKQEKRRGFLLFK